MNASSTFLDHRDHGVEQEHEADRAHERALHVIDELHDLDRDVVAVAAERLQELEQHRFELLVVAECLEHRKGDRHDRHDREQRRIDETHGAETEFAPEQIAYQRIEEPQRGRRPA